MSCGWTPHSEALLSCPPKNSAPGTGHPTILVAKNYASAELSLAFHEELSRFLAIVFVTVCLKSNCFQSESGLLQAAEKQNKVSAHSIGLGNPVPGTWCSYAR